MSTKKVVTLFGVFLVLLQLLNLIGLSKSPVGLFPTYEDPITYVSPVDQGPLTGAKLAFAITAGCDKFRTSFRDLSLDKYEYVPMEADQYTSLFIRESLGCSTGGSTGLFIYDALLTISYSFLGIVGMLFVVIGLRIKDNEQ